MATRTVEQWRRARIGPAAQSEIARRRRRELSTTRIELSAIAAPAITCTCAQDPDIRILRRVPALNAMPLSPRGEGPFRKIAILDVETTGTDPARDEIIDLAVVVLEVDDLGEIVGSALRRVRASDFPGTHRHPRHA